MATDPHYSEKGLKLQRLSHLLIGTESLLVHCGEALLQAGHHVAAVVTTSSDLAAWARSRGVPYHDSIEAVSSPRSVDVLLSIGNLRVLGPEALAVARLGGINFHDGPLPDVGGLNTPAWAILRGDPEHGVTWHWMTTEPDAGPIIAARRWALMDGETTLTLNTRCFEAGIDSFADVLAALDRGETPASRTGTAPHRMVRRSERPGANGTIDWAQPAASLSALVRGLDTGPYANPLSLAKSLVPGGVLHVPTLTVLDRRSGAAPGTVVAVADDGITVATGSDDVRIPGFRTLEGDVLAAREAQQRFGLREGDLLVVPEPLATRLTSTARELSPYEDWWVRYLGRIEPGTLPFPESTAPRSGTAASVPIDLGTLPTLFGAAPADVATALVAGLLARLRGRSEFSVQYSDPVLRDLTQGLEHWFAPLVPIRLRVPFDAPFADLVRAVEGELGHLRRRVTYPTDLPVRYPALRALPHVLSRSLPLAIVVAEDVDRAPPAAGSDVTFVLGRDGTRGRLHYDTGRLTAPLAASVAARVAQLARGFLEQPDVPLGEQSLLSDAERRQQVVEWNATALPLRADDSIDGAVHFQAEAEPQRLAIAYRDTLLTRRELDERVSRLAHVLVGLGVGPDVRVGLELERDANMIVAMLAVLRAGGAYVPLDPSYPPERLALMLEDSGAKVLLTAGRQDEATGVRVLPWEECERRMAEQPATPPATRAAGDNLAYVIYTSGSTGRPKGVMVERRNVLNFFAAMDHRLGTTPGTWLAVTSISFDISVLELLWTLGRGYTVVLHREGRVQSLEEHPAGTPSLSLFYFASADGRGQDTYRLLVEGARFADAHGFEAVWTPERHFHEFGGIYPNPAVTGAAVAAVTERVQVRAGSVVLPLHHPARVAEEWAVVDNLSGGRVGIAFASGWQPNDFVLKPEAYAQHRQVMQRDLEVVRRLWRGEQVTFPGVEGAPVPVRTLPRPVQPELPIWLTAAGNPDTYVLAGQLGANVLTHLLGQSVEELAAKLTRYRQAWRAAGHPGEGRVTLMLHTFVGASDPSVKEAVRLPLLRYLQSSVDLIRNYAWSFPALKQARGERREARGDVFDLDALSEQEREDVLSYAFERYYETSGLFGTPETCLTRVDQLTAIGVDEIACLIDFGIPTETALAHLEWLNRLKDLMSAPRTARLPQHSLPAVMARHGVTHMQCTPSLARLLLADPATRAVLGGLTHLLLGGEALGDQLADDVQEALGGDSARAALYNMYGPTETTVWSSMHRVERDDRPVSIGTPLANTQLYVLDGRGQLLPAGVPGELYIGGRGVTRGYLGLEEMTASRFVPDPFAATGRMYRTGDRVRWRTDGTVEFLGRLDQQVKLSGHRIELGEIEVQLAQHPEVQEAVVLAREDRPDDVRLVAYVVFRHPPGDGAQLRTWLRRQLPDFMVPSTVVALDRLPMTPNGKVDRRTLPPPASMPDAAPLPEQRPANAVEGTIAEVWRDLLRVAHVNRDANFFDLGGHSLLAVQVHRRLRALLPERALTITDLFRFPTVASLAGYLSGSTGSDVRLQDVTARGEARRTALQRRATRRGAS